MFLKYLCFYNMPSVLKLVKHQNQMCDIKICLFLTYLTRSSYIHINSYKCGVVVNI